MLFSAKHGQAKARAITTLVAEIKAKFGETNVRALEAKYVEKGYDADVVGGLLESEILKFVKSKSSKEVPKISDTLVQQAFDYITGDIQHTEKVVRER